MSSETLDSSAWSTIEIGLPVAELEVMRRFYCDGLGFRYYGSVKLPKAHIQGYRLGNSLLKLTLFADEAARPRPQTPSPQSIYLTLRLTGLADIIARCQSIGAAVLVPLSTAVTETGQEVQFAFLADPMGNRIEIVDGDAWSPA
jgi:catechol 2,3-dioxygenase-like lactoylglutathione lyase family enzyme